MQQRQPRLGDIVDDYCPRERRLTNHAVVAMVNADVKRTRCTTCDAEHEYKQARVPRQRRKVEPPALHAQVLANVAPKKVTVEVPNDPAPPVETQMAALPPSVVPETASESRDESHPAQRPEEGPVHRRLIRAQLPRHEGQVPVVRQAPEFTIRQPGGGRPGRFRPRHQRSAQGGSTFQGGRPAGNANGNVRGGTPRPPHGRSSASHPARQQHQGAGRKRSK